MTPPCCEFVFIAVMRIKSMKPVGMFADQPGRPILRQIMKKKIQMMHARTRELLRLYMLFHFSRFETVSWT